MGRREARSSPWDGQCQPCTVSCTDGWHHSSCGENPAPSPRCFCSLKHTRQIFPPPSAFFFPFFFVLLSHFLTLSFSFPFLLFPFFDFSLFYFFFIFLFIFTFTVFSFLFFFFLLPLFKIFFFFSPPLITKKELCVLHCRRGCSLPD